MIEYLLMAKIAELPKKLKRARMSAGFSQKELAEKLGLSGKTISAYEKARAVPPTPTLARISEITKVPVQDIIGERQVSYNGEILKSIRELNSSVRNIERLLEQLAREGIYAKEKHKKSN